MRCFDKFLASTVLAAGMTLVTAGAVLAQTAPGNPSTQQMIDQLKPHTRGLIIGGGSAPPAAAPATSSSAATGTTNPDTRGLIIGGGSAPAATAPSTASSNSGMAAPTRPAANPTVASPTPMTQPPVASARASASPTAAKPSLNLRVLFAFNSAELTPEARTTLDNLGRALQSAELRSSRFEVAGHTDATGDAESNKRLSDERAAAVKNYLVTNFGVDASRIQSVGYGKAELLDPSHPTSAINRRVQVTNLSAAG